MMSKIKDKSRYNGYTHYKVILHSLRVADKTLENLIEESRDITKEEILHVLDSLQIASRYLHKVINSKDTFLAAGLYLRHTNTNLKEAMSYFRSTNVGQRQVKYLMD